MPNASSKRKLPQPDFHPEDAVAPPRAARRGGRTLGPREQLAMLEAAYSQPEPAVAQYSGVAKVAIMGAGVALTWGGIMLAARVLSGH